MAQYTQDLINYSRFRNLPGVVYTRSGVAYQQDASGVWVPFDEDVPPISDGVGLGVWEARTNSIRNPTGLGAVVGPVGGGGALPLNWVVQYNPSAVNTEVVALSIESGLPTIDLRFWGTWGATGQFNLGFDGSASIGANNGETWTERFFARKIAGGFGGISQITANLAQHTSIGGYVAAMASANLIPSLSSASLASCVVQATFAGGATVARTQPQLEFRGPSGQTFDMTLRIAAPNLKLGANINDPPILQTNNAAATRGAASAYINAPGLLVPPFTLFAQFNMPQPLASTYPRVLRAISDGGTDVCDIYIAPGRTPRAFVMTGGVTQADFGSRVVAEGAQTKVAVRFKTDSIAMSVNGLAVETDTSATLISQYSKLYYGTTGASGYFNGAIQRFQIINRDLSDAELQALTT